MHNIWAMADGFLIQMDTIGKTESSLGVQAADDTVTEVLRESTNCKGHGLGISSSVPTDSDSDFLRLQFLVITDSAQAAAMAPLGNKGSFLNRKHAAVLK
jgi:hypothetical protein